MWRISFNEGLSAKATGTGEEDCCVPKGPSGQSIDLSPTSTFEEGYNSTYTGVLTPVTRF